MRKYLLMLLLALLVIPGCYYDNEEELYPNTFCDTANVSYSNTIAPIVQAKCAIPGCHVAGGSGTGNFNDFTQLTAQIQNGRLLPSIRRDPSAIPMPPSGPLRQCELDQFELWIAAGASND